MPERLEIQTVDGVVVTSINENDWTIMLAVQDSGRGDAWVSLSPADVQVLAESLICQVDAMNIMRSTLMPNL